MGEARGGMSTDCAVGISESTGVLGCLKAKRRLRVVLRSLDPTCEAPGESIVNFFSEGHHAQNLSIHS